MSCLIQFVPKEDGKAFAAWGPINGLHIPHENSLLCGWDIYTPYYFGGMEKDGKTVQPFFRMRRATTSENNLSHYVFGSHSMHALMMPEFFAADHREFPELPDKSQGKPEYKYLRFMINDMKKIYEEVCMVAEELEEDINYQGW